MPHRGKTMRQSWVSVRADDLRLSGGGLLRERRGLRLHGVLEARHFGEFLRALGEADAARRDLARLAGFAERGDDLSVVARADEGLDARDGVFEAHALLVGAVG